MGTFLIVKYNDGVVKRMKDGQFERNSIGQPAGVLRPGYPKEFLQEYVKQTGEDDDYIDVNFSRADNELTEQANQVYEALKEKDIESIKKVFAPCIAEKYDLDKEIKKLIKKIEGNVISIGEASGWTTGYVHTVEKGYEWVDSEEWLENIKTDKGYSYCLYLDGYYSNQESEEKVGMGNLILYKGSEIFKNKLYELGDSE